MEKWRDFYGCTAYIKPQRDGSVKLTIWTGVHRIFSKVYSTYRGAKVAMGKQGDCWEKVEA